MRRLGERRSRARGVVSAEAAVATASDDQRSSRTTTSALPQSLTEASVSRSSVDTLSLRVARAALRRAPRPPSPTRWPMPPGSRGPSARRRPNATATGFPAGACATSSPHFALRARGTIRVVGTTVSFDKLAEPTAVQRRALEPLQRAYSPQRQNRQPPIPPPKRSVGLQGSFGLGAEFGSLSRRSGAVSTCAVCGPEPPPSRARVLNPTVAIVANPAQADRGRDRDAGGRGCRRAAERRVSQRVGTSMPPEARAASSPAFPFGWRCPPRRRR